MGTRRFTACAALVAALLLVMSGPAVAVVTGPVSEIVDRVERTFEEVDEVTEDAVDDVERAVDEVLREEPDDDPDGEPEDDGDPPRDDEPSEGSDVEEATPRTVERSSPAAVLPLLRAERSHQTSLSSFRVADRAAADVVEAPLTIDDVLDPVVRADETDVSPASETPIMAAPARAQAVTATPEGMRWYTALGAAALILLLVSTGLLAEIRPGVSERS